MAREPLIHLVGLNCAPGNEEAFNKWYNEVHVPMMLEFEKVKAATRYERVPCSMGAHWPSVKYPNYLALYEFENEKDAQEWDVAPCMDKNRAEAKTQTVPSYERLWRARYKAIKTWER